MDSGASTVGIDGLANRPHEVPSMRPMRHDVRVKSVGGEVRSFL